MLTIATLSCFVLSAAHESGIVEPEHAIRFASHKATVLVFLYPDCPVANRYAPELNAIFDAYREAGAAFFRVYAGDHLDENAVIAHTKEYAYQFPAVLDPALDLVRLTGASVTPEAIVFDAHGKRRYRGRVNNRYVDYGRYRPAPTQHDLRDALDAVLADREVTQPETKAIGCFLPQPPDAEPAESHED